MFKHYSRIELAITGAIIVFLLSLMVSPWVLAYLEQTDDLQLQVVTTPEDMAKGLTGLTSLPKGSGMLFKWDKAEIRCMWAKDMQFDLDLVYLDDGLHPIQTEVLIAGTTTPHCSNQPVKYALEVNRGELIRN